MAQRFFSGRESWVFRAQSLDELCGHHPDLIASALGQDETVSFLLYSPLRETSAGPFAVTGAPGSHGLALTETHAIVSRDPHSSAARRTARAIPYRDVLDVELGEALTLGWLTFRFVSKGAVAVETIFFHATGIELFRAATRLVRAAGSRVAAEVPIEATVSPALADAPAYLRTQLEPLLLADEEIQGAFRTSLQWRVGTGGRPSCETPDQLHLLSDRGALIVESERPHIPGELVFATRCVCFDVRTVADVTVSPSASEAEFADLVFELTCGGAVTERRYRVDAETALKAKDLFTPR